MIKVEDVFIHKKFFEDPKSSILFKELIDKLSSWTLFQLPSLVLENSNPLFPIIQSILWIIGNRGLEFSNTREGNWNSVQLDNLSINSLKSIEDLGSSKNFLWIKTSSTFIKLDHVSGSFLGVFAYPDEKNIDWGDIGFKDRYLLKDFLFEDYFIEQGPVR